MKWLISFDNENSLLSAVQTLRKNGVDQIETLSPYPIEGLDDALDKPVRAQCLALVTFVGGLTGIVTAFTMEAYSAGVDSPLNVGGRPLFSWPAFVPITFILMILGAASFLIFTFIYRLHLPELAHPVFSSPSFDLSQDRFAVLVEGDAATGQKLNSLSAEEVEEFVCH